ncbi:MULTISPECIES: hypothetical protein [Lachnospiraceae]|nr:MULTISPECIES: hypothetical protein [Lachnospiraceae]
MAKLRLHVFAVSFFRSIPLPIPHRLGFIRTEEMKDQVGICSLGF